MNRLVSLSILYLLLTACVLVQPTPTAAPAATPTPTLVPTPQPSAETPAGFHNFLSTIESTILEDRPPLLNSYWAQIKRTPLVNQEQAIFLYRGEASSVLLTGDMTGWQDATGSGQAEIPLERINGTDLWWHEMAFEPTARLDYNFIINAENRADPTNPLTVPSSFGAHSELRMAGYSDPDWLLDQTDYTAGVLTEHAIDSEFLGGRRTFLVYKPSSQLVGAKRPALIVQDGSEAVNLINMPRLFDTLIGRRDLPPLVIAFVPPFDRGSEYWRDDAYADFLALEVLPFLQAEYDTDPAPEENGLLGASLGGLISLHTAMRHPEHIGLVAAQSGAFTVDDDRIINDLASASPLPLKLHLVTGTYETNVAPQIFADANFYAGNQRLATVLEQKGYEFIFEEFQEGHSWGLWRSQLGAALEYLFK